MKKLFSFMIGLFFLLSVPMMVFAEEVPTPSDDAAAVADFVADEEMDEPEVERFNISGFMAARYTYYDWQDEKNVSKVFSSVVGEGDHFSVDNINLYFRFNADENWLAFTEIRFVYGPIGSEVNNDHDNDVNTPDLVYPGGSGYSDNQLAKFGTSGLYLERAYIEWNKYDFFKVRGGQYLTPYGIWSQDHGDPALVSVRAPYVVGTAFDEYGMPISQVGIELFGSVAIPSTEISVDWATYIGNGISNDSSRRDRDDTGKSFGGFLNIKIPEIFDFINIEFGASGYMGNRSYITSYNYDASSTKVNITYDTKQKDKIGVAHYKMEIVDLPLDGVLTLQGEWLRHWVSDNEIISPFTGVAEKKYTFDVFYVQAEYSMLGWITPYFRYEKEISPDNYPFRAFVFDSLDMYISGINIKPIPKITLKLEAGIYRAKMESTSTYVHDWNIYQASMSMAF